MYMPRSVEIVQLLVILRKQLTHDHQNAIVVPWFTSWCWAANGFWRVHVSTRWHQDSLTWHSRVLQPDPLTNPPCRGAPSASAVGLPQPQLCWLSLSSFNAAANASFTYCLCSALTVSRLTSWNTTQIKCRVSTGHYTSFRATLLLQHSKHTLQPGVVFSSSIQLLL